MSGNLHRSRGAYAPEAWASLPPPRTGGPGESTPAKCEGDGAPSGASSPSVHDWPHRPAWRLSARRRGDFCPWRRASRRRPGGYFVPPIRAASAALRLRHVQPLKAGPRSGAGRLARASRVRGQRTHARGRRPCPRDRRNRFASPRGQGEGEYKPSWEGGDKFSRKCDYGPIKRGGERLFRVVIAGLIPAIHGTAPEVQHTVQV